MKRGTIDHPKMKRLVRELGLVVSTRSELGFVTVGGHVPLCLAAGILECLWHFTARHAPQGDVGRWGDADIADAVGWPTGEAEGLIGALVEAGWVDRHDGARLLVHDWSEHCDDAVHTSLARAKLRFADGSAPKIGKLGGQERKAAEEWLELTATEEDGRNGQIGKAEEERHAEASAQRAHGVRTECAGNRPALAFAIDINSLSSAREAFKAMHIECGRVPDMAIDNALRGWPQERWKEAIEAMGRHYAGDAPMRRPPLAILENYLSRGPKAKPVPDGPVKRGRDWKAKTYVPEQGDKGGVERGTG